MIDILITCYNKEDTITEVINSVAQLSNINKIIIIDDASTDNSLKIITKISQKFRNVDININETNQGVAESRNELLNKSTCEYIAFVDGDDIIIPDEKQKQIEFVLENKDIDFCYSDYRVGRNVKRSLPFDYNALKSYNYIPFSSVICRRKFLTERYMKFEKTFHEDYWLWLNCLCRLDHETVSYFPSATYIYGTGENRITSNKFKSAYHTFLLLSKFHGYPYIPFRYIVHNLKKRLW